MSHCNLYAVTVSPIRPLHVNKVSRYPMTDSIREAVRIELARRDWNRTKLAQETDLTRQYVGELMTGKAGNLSDSWGRIFDALDLEVVVRPKRKPKGEPTG